MARHPAAIGAAAVGAVEAPIGAVLGGAMPEGAGQEVIGRYAASIRGIY